MKTVENLNDKQQAVVDSTSRRLLCLAGAGTGKTLTMLAKIIKLTQDGVDPRSILVLTFTNAAAQEMQSRYESRCETSLERNIHPEFRTFHSFCYSLLVKDIYVRAKLGYREIPDIVQDEYVKSIQSKVTQQLGIKHTFKHPIENMKLQMQYDTYCKAVDRELIRNNVITFDKLCYGVCKLFESKDDCVSAYIQKYKYIFVDEMQDTDPSQFRFVESFKDSSIFLVGDALQSLYTFRGADSTIIKKLSVSPDWTVFKLTENYRSVKQICDYANKLSFDSAESYRVYLDSSRPGGFVGEKYVNMGYRRDTVCDDTLQFLKSFSSPGSTAVLCRTNKEVDFIAEYLTSNEIPFSCNRLSTDVVDILRSIDNESYALNWISSKLNSSDYASYIRKSFLLQQSDSPYTFSDFVKDFENCSSVYTMLSMLKSCIDIYKSTEDIRSVCDFLHIDDYNAESFEDLVERMLDSDTTKCDLYVGTVHSVKGLEFDNVILVGVDGPSFRLTVSDNMNVYYVGCTRARTNLYIFKNRRSTYEVS